MLLTPATFICLPAGPAGIPALRWRWRTWR